MNMNRYAVFGNPIAHSQSPLIHQLFAEQTHISLTYEAILVPLTLNELSKTLDQFQKENGKGANITLPFKQEAYFLVNTLSDRAICAKAINTIRFNLNGSRYGDNTDGIGLVRDLTLHQKQNLHNKTILILGAGGAVSGILAALIAEKPAKILIANRTATKAKILANRFIDLMPIEYCALENLKKPSFDLIINAMSVGLSGTMPVLPNGLIHAKTFCYDLVYDLSSLTPFLVWAKNQGAHSYCDGLGMLVEQAAEAFYLWHHIRPNTTKILKIIKT